MKNLVIVESPSKSKTIGKYLGKDYTVVSSKGHIRDLAIKGKEGLGADDRAGVFAIIQILRKKYRPYVLFTTDEEMGGYGAHIFVEAHPVAPNIKYMIELDRAGERDCVFYECENFTFMDYVESFGFKQAIGSFTDISIIMPEWEIAGVNLSGSYIFARASRRSSGTDTMPTFGSIVQKG